MIVCATVLAAYTGTLAQVSSAAFEAAKTAVTLAIGLIGSMALWLGIIQVVETAGGMQMIANFIRPVMIRLFPEVPPQHPAMSAIILNIAANALGLGNAATPLGLKAMAELEKLNPNPGIATDAMCLFLAINTSSVTLLPISVITVRASAGVENPAAIIFPALIATTCSTVAAIAAAKFFVNIQPERENLSHNSTILSSDYQPEETKSHPQLTPPGKLSQLVFSSLLGIFLGAIFHQLTVHGIQNLTSLDFLQELSEWLIPIIICSFLLFGYFRGVKVYEVFTEGATEGFQVAVRVIPFLVAIFVAIGMLRASGALDLFALLISPLTSLIGFPSEAVPMALIRPLSGSGSFALMSEIISYSPNSFLADFVSTLQGSTETTFYVLAVYFGSINIRDTRYAVPAALCADVVGVFAALIICRVIF